MRQLLIITLLSFYTSFLIAQDRIELLERSEKLTYSEGYWHDRKDDQAPPEINKNETPSGGRLEYIQFLKVRHKGLIYYACAYAYQPSGVISIYIFHDFIYDEILLAFKNEGHDSLTINSLMDYFFYIEREEGFNEASLLLAIQQKLDNPPNYSMTNGCFYLKLFPNQDFKPVLDKSKESKGLVKMRLGYPCDKAEFRKEDHEYLLTSYNEFEKLLIKKDSGTALINLDSKVDAFFNDDLVEGTSMVKVSSLLHDWQFKEKPLMVSNKINDTGYVQIQVTIKNGELVLTEINSGYTVSHETAELFRRFVEKRGITPKPEDENDKSIGIFDQMNSSSSSMHIMSAMITSTTISFELQ